MLQEWMDFGYVKFQEVVLVLVVLVLVVLAQQSFEFLLCSIKWY